MAAPMQTTVDDTVAMILCCMCGSKIRSNPSNMCVQCLRGQVDITEGISKQVSIWFCRGCGRYERPPWVFVELESRELLALCLKKIRGLGKEVKLVDASFVWTEPHSRRIKVKLTIQREVMNSAILQQSCVVEFVVENKQCPDCAASYTEHTWGAVVQVRQKVRHKRTFFWLEQLMLKHGAAEKAINVREQPEGLDFFFATKGHAATMVSWLAAVVPTRNKTSKRLISQDFSSNTQRYKFSFLVDIAPICRQDLVILPPKLASLLGGMRPLVICHKVTASLHLVDPHTLATAELNADKFFRNHFDAVLTSRELTEYVVLDVEMGSPNAVNPNATSSSHRFALAEVQVMRAADMGVSDTILYTRTHLGNVLHPGDHVLGYDLVTTNLPSGAMRPMQRRGIDPPDVVLVKKHYPRTSRRQRKRNFELGQLPNKEAPARERRKVEAARDDKDREELLCDIEEDPDMWDHVNMYRRARAPRDDDTKSESGDEEDAPAVPLERLLANVSLSSAAASSAAAAAAASSSAGAAAPMAFGVPAVSEGDEAGEADDVDM